MAPTTTQTAVADLRSDLDDLLAPLRSRLSVIDALIASRETELKDLRDARRQVARMMDIADPAPAAKKKAAKTSPSGGLAVKAETLNEVEDWLRQRASRLNSNGGFSGPTLQRDFGFDLIAKATLRNALNQLHDQGRLLLDHRGKGGALFYKVPTDGR